MKNWIVFVLMTINTAHAQRSSVTVSSSSHSFNGTYTGTNLEHISFPIGGLGAGMFCLDGNGAISHVSIRNKPEVFNEPMAFAAIGIKGQPNSARVLEGPVPGWKKFSLEGAGEGDRGRSWGLARFREAEFLGRFPFANIKLSDKDLPLEVTITGWSPFIPTDVDNSSLPVGALEYHFKNTGKTSLDYVFSFNSEPQGDVKPMQGGVIFSGKGSENVPENQSDLAVFTDEQSAVADYCWFRGGWFDPLTMAWKHIREARVEAVAPQTNSSGVSIFVPFRLKPGQEKTVRLLLTWYTPNSKLRFGSAIKDPNDSTVRDASVDLPSQYYKPWYSSKFANITGVIDYWLKNYVGLQKKSAAFRDAFYKSSLPPEVMEAVAANLSILKSPTVLRQYDGRFWGWEGCGDNYGSCSGSCTHVWNYAQALSHLFPSMERSLRETEFFESQNAEGHQQFRSALPIRPEGHGFRAASDGQLGGIMKVYREWRISGDSNWLRRLYPRVKSSLDYCIKTWDPRHKGIPEEPHHNTYDIEFWGPDGMTTSFYLGALEAMIKMGEYLKENVFAYHDLYTKGKQFMEQQLYNGEYFVQKIQWVGLNAPDPVIAAQQSIHGNYSLEALDLLQKEGPKYQYGKGCLSDGVLGDWLARVCGLNDPLDSTKVKNHLQAVYKYNLKKDLSGYSNPQRPGYALGNEGGLLLCTWPQGGELSLPFVYSNEVWTGIEYQVASHLIFEGKVKEGLDVVRTCRSRYDGKVRNPFDEYECGHWYARAMSSYALIESLTGVRYDAVDQTLYVNSKMGEFISFLSTDKGFGNIIYKNGKASLQVAYGEIPVRDIRY